MEKWKNTDWEVGGSTFQVWAAGSLETIEHLALHAVLDLTPAQHELQHFSDGVLWVFLLGEVLDNAVFRHLGANGKTALELLLNAAQHLLVLLGSEALHP